MESVGVPSLEQIDLMDGFELDEALFRLEQGARRIEERGAAIIGRAEQIGAFGALGFANVTGWVAANANTFRGNAREHIRIAHVASALPSLHAALVGGQLGIAQALLLARLHANPRCVEPLHRCQDELVKFGIELPLRDFQVVLNRFESYADPDGQLKDSETTRRNRTAATRTLGSGWELRAFSDAVDGEEFDAILDHFSDIEFDLDWAAAKEIHGDATDASHLARTHSQRRLDALMAMARTAKAGTAAIANDPSITIVADPATTIEAILAHYQLPVPPIDPSEFSSRQCETLLAAQLTREQLLAALLIGRIQILWRQPGTRNVELGRRQRFHNRAMRDAISILDRWCSHGGNCPQPATRCEIDHATAWPAGGTTGVVNGDPGCHTHHRNKHIHGLTVHWTPTGWKWQTSNGTPITPTTRPDQPTNCDERGPP